MHGPGTMKERLHQRLNKILDRVHVDDFLHGKGLGNEIPFFAFDYSPGSGVGGTEHIAFPSRKIPKRARAAVRPQSTVRPHHPPLKDRGFYDKALDLQKRKGRRGPAQRPLAAPLDAGSCQRLRRRGQARAAGSRARSGSAAPTAAAHPQPAQQPPSPHGQHPAGVVYPGVYDGQVPAALRHLGDKPYYRAFRLVD